METISLSRTSTFDNIDTSQWTITEVTQLFELPFMELMFQAQSIHRQFHKVGEVQLSTLLSIKTGGCPEDCSYCPQWRARGVVLSDAPRNRNTLQHGRE